MPQMSPLSWSWLMIVFLIMLIMINSMMYFNKKYITMTKKSESTTKQINWKW